MWTELPFRIALVVVIGLTMAVIVYHRLQAAKSGERISHAEEGYAFALTLRLAGLGLWLVTLAYLLYPPGITWASLPIAHSVRWSGVILGIACAPLMLWTLASLGHNLTDTVVTRAQASLVTHGPYRWVRHPFYVVAALLMAAVTILTANWLIGVCASVVLALLVVRTPREEQQLIARFGDDYRRYMASTGRFFPRLLGRSKSA